MALSSTSEIPLHRSVLEFWFGRVPAPDLPADEIKSRWFSSNAEFDARIRRQFGALVTQAIDGGLADWEHLPRGRLALVLLLDQFTRNLFRGSERAFAGDPRALSLADEAVATGADRALTLCERSFLYLPFEHAEDRHCQVQSLRCFRSLVDEAAPECREHYAGCLEFAERHKVVIDRFGRFPHRNAVLGRASTVEEQHHLADTPAGF